MKKTKKIIKEEIYDYLRKFSVYDGGAWFDLLGNFKLGYIKYDSHTISADKFIEDLIRILKTLRDRNYLIDLKQFVVDETSN